MPRKTKKGLEALKSAEVQEIVEKVEELTFWTEHGKALDKELKPMFVDAEETLAEAENLYHKRVEKIMAVRLVQYKLKELENEDTEYRKLIQEKKELENLLNATSRRVDGVVIYRTPDTADVRAKLTDVSKKIGAIRAQVGLFVGGALGLDISEAFEMVRQDDAAYNKS